MNSTLSLKRHWSVLAFFIVLFGTGLPLIAQTTLGYWKFDNTYAKTGTNPYNYTPTATPRVAADGLDVTLNSADIVYPDSYQGNQTDYKMSISAVGAKLRNVYQTTTTYHNSATLGASVVSGDFTNPANHGNYYQFSFSTIGYYKITLDINMTTQNDTDDYLQVVYSIDGGSTWTVGDQALGNCCWWTTVARTTTIVAKNKSNVIVRLIGVKGGATSGNYFYLNSFKVSGTSTTLPTNTASTINWAFNLGTAGQTATYTDATYYKPDNVLVGSNYAYLGTKAGTNPAVTYTSLKNITTSTTPAGANTNNLIGFEFTPVAGLNFVPTNISFKCQRFGTDLGLIDVYWKSSDGTSTLIATGVKPARDGDAVSEAADTNTFTMNVSGLSIPALVGKSTLQIYIHSLESAKDVGLAGISITGYLNGTLVDVNQYTVTTAVSPSVGGTIVSDNPATVDQGTVVSLTANANFCYSFSNWTDGSGNVVSTSNPYILTVNGNTTVNANFNTLTTYALDLAVNGGGKNYMVNISPAGTMVNGSRMYVEGTNVTLTASEKPILNFSNWGTGETNNVLAVTMNGNKSITATYNAANYIVGWDFYDDVVNVDFSSNVANNATTLVLRDAAGATSGGLNFSTVANPAGWYGKNCRINWNSLANKFYYQIKINATDYTDIRVQAAMLASYSGYPVQKCEYSINGTDFTTIGTYDTSTLNTWKNGSFNLPADANNKAEVYIRWIPDYTTTPIGSGNDGTSISDIYVYGTPSIINDGIAPILASSVPANNATGASVTGKVVLTFDESVKIAGNTTVTLNGKQLTPVVFGKSISFNYSGLNYNTTYTFNLAGNVISDLADNTLTNAISISFTTSNKPTVTKKGYDFIVGVDGNFASALEAADAAKNSGNRFYIFFPNGEYDLGTTTGDATQQTIISLPNISFIGQSTEGVTLFNSPTQAQEGIDKTPTINFTSTANNIYMQDLTLFNKMDYHLGIPEKRAVALRHQGDKNIFKNVRLLSNQDTYFTGAGRTYWENGEIHGTVDYIFGDGDIFFNQCLLYMENRSTGGGGVATAAATSSNWGYVFNNCTIAGDAQQNGIYNLGRPWNIAPKVVYINTTMNILPTAGAWGDPMNVVPFRFAEYNSLTSSGTAVDLSQRRTTYTKDATTVTLDPTLDASEAAQYTVENVLGGNDVWQPTFDTEQVTAPVLSISGSTLNWADSNYVLGWAVFKDDIFIDFVTTNSFDISGNTTGIYSIRAANGMGGLGNSSNQVDISGSTTWNGTAWSNTTGPDSTLEAIIDGTYSTSTNGGFTAKKLTVNSGKSLTVNSGTNITVQNEVINSGSFVVENNANLIQVNNTTNTGAITVNRNSNTLLRLDYTLWSSPVVSQNLADFSPLTSQSPSRFYSYNSTSDLYSTITTPATTNFTPCAGYLIRMPNTADAVTPTAFTGVFTGVPNNGNVAYTLSNAGNGFNLVGNPYPSPISMSQFVADNTANITGTLYFWRKTNGIGTAYCTWTAGTYVTNSNAQSVDPLGIIQTGQGFFVKANAAGSVTFKNGQRVANNAGQFFRTKQVVKSDKIWLNVTNATGDFSQMAVTYSATATQGVDAFDGKYINDSSFALTSNINNEEYTIQGRPAFDASDVVPLNFKTGVVGDYTIAIDHADGVFAAGQDVVLVDNTTGTETSLTTSSYTFTAAAGANSSRFALKYQKTLGTNQSIFNDNNMVVYKNKGILYVNAGDATIANIKVYDVQGKLVAELKNVKATSATITNLKATNQVLVVRATLADNNVVTKKVVN